MSHATCLVLGQPPPPPPCAASCGSFLSTVPLCCLPWRTQSQCLAAEPGGSLGSPRGASRPLEFASVWTPWPVSTLMQCGSSAAPQLPACLACSGPAQSAGVSLLWIWMQHAGKQLISNARRMILTGYLSDLRSHRKNSMMPGHLLGSAV